MNIGSGQGSGRIFARGAEGRCVPPYVGQCGEECRKQFLIFYLHTQNIYEIISG